MTSRTFPFQDVVGQGDAKLALMLVAVDPHIGGVLLRGHKGSAKTTLARGLADLLGDAPFVELPLGATEDRLVGTLDTEAALTGEGFRFRPGLLAEADGGVLYVDEVNLLADHLVDTLLDVSVSGENVVERDGVSHRHPARFVLVGSMNPEEGELRPQMLDRFGFCVEMTAPADIGLRVEALRRRLAFEGHPLVASASPAAGGAGAGGGPDADVGGGTETGAVQRLAGRIGTATPAAIPDAVLEGAARLAVEVGVEGLRADLTLSRAAAALAGLEGRSEAAPDDLRRVAPLALAHRSRRGPFDPPAMPPDQLDRALDEALGDEGSAERDDAGGDPEAPRDGSDDGGQDSGGRDGADRDPPDGNGDDGDSGGSPGAAGDRPLVLGTARRPPTPQGQQALAPRGRVVRDVPAGNGRPVAVAPTVRALAGRRASDPGAVLAPEDLRAEVKMAPMLRTIVICVDLSGSMGAALRAEAATGTVLGLLADAYQQRDRVALVGFRGEGADILLNPTSSIEVARNRLDGLVTGGATPLAEGITQALDVAVKASVGERDEALIVVITDGRATGRDGAVDAALAAANGVRARGIRSLVLDCEAGPVRLGLAGQLAEAMGAPCVDGSALDPDALVGAIRSLAPS